MPEMYEIKVSMDYTLDNFEIVEWHKNVGDKVEVGDELCTVETQKSAESLVALVSGVLREIKIGAGEVVEKPEGLESGKWSCVVGCIETEDV